MEKKIQRGRGEFPPPPPLANLKVQKEDIYGVIGGSTEQRLEGENDIYLAHPIKRCEIVSSQCFSFLIKYIKSFFVIISTALHFLPFSLIGDNG